MQNLVGPIFIKNERGKLWLSVMKTLNPEILVVDRGSYFRVTATNSCHVEREALEAALGNSVNLAVDLETVMLSFAGQITVTEDHITWSAI